MSLISTSDIIPESKLENVHQQLTKKVFRGIDGFFAKYFEDRPCSAAVDEVLNRLEMFGSDSKLSTDLLEASSLDRLVKALGVFESLTVLLGNPKVHFQCQCISEANQTFGASIYLKTNGEDSAASTLCFGEIHHGQEDFSGGENRASLLSFFERARWIFELQPTRIYLHAFLISRGMLELWVFDRAGAYSSKKFDLAARPDLLTQVLIRYAFMTDADLGLNLFVKQQRQPLRGESENEADAYVEFEELGKLHLHTCITPTPSLAGPGTTCYATPVASADEPRYVIKFSWRLDEAPSELRVLEMMRARNVQGAVRLLAAQNLASTADHRRGLDFPEPVKNHTLSCVATTPLGRPIQQYESIPELLEALRDLAKALRSLYVDGRMLHRDIAIKNTIINLQEQPKQEQHPQQHGVDYFKGVLIDLDFALDLDTNESSQFLTGSDGFMAVGILQGQPHSYRHDLESLFYILLWLAIGNDREHAEATDIVKGLPRSSRLHAWCPGDVLDFQAIGRAKAADMSPAGFVELLDEFSPDFVPLRGLARDLHALLFPIRNGKIFTGTDEGEQAMERLYAEMAAAFDRSARAFRQD